MLSRVFGGDGWPTSVSELDAGWGSTSFTAGYNVAFSFGGLQKLGIAPDALYSFPPEFIQGMARRTETNRDEGWSSPKHWEGHWRERQVDFWLGVYARTAEGRDSLHAALVRHLSDHRIKELAFDEAHRFVADGTPVWIDDPDRQPGPGKPLEHFGFQDGISNPPIKGLDPAGPTVSYGGGSLDDKGNWHQVAAGEFLYGYLDEVGEMPPSPVPIGIGSNGTYMVLRKLSQDVDAFRAYVGQLAAQHEQCADELAEKMVGRKRNGGALVTAPPSGDSNDFVYGDDTDGQICPKGSHVRRVNPRDTLNFASRLVDRHRLLRRGIPYGKLVPRDLAQSAVNPLVQVDGIDTPLPGQGLLFIALNIDIARQFEFVQSQWVNFANDLNQGSDRDPIVGSHEPQHPKHNRMVLLMEADQSVIVCPEIPSFVETRGGDYFFVPGINALRAIVDGQYD
jgi:Dyp-type peroxidase family